MEYLYEFYISGLKVFTANFISGKLKVCLLLFVDFLVLFLSESSQPRVFCFVSIVTVCLTTHDRG